MGRKDTYQNGNRSYPTGGREGAVGYSHFILYACDIKKQTTKKTQKTKKQCSENVTRNRMCLKEAMKCLRLSFNR